MAFQFRYKKLFHRLLEILRELFIGKMAAVVVAWVMKNALFYSIIIVKAGTVGKDPKTLLEPEYASTHGLQLMGYSLSTFLILLLTAALLAYLITQGGWSGFMKDSALQQVGAIPVDGDLSRSLQGVISHREASQILTEMSNFYAAGLVFIPAWAYKDFIDRTQKYFTIRYEDTATGTVVNATGSLVNRTELGIDTVLDDAGIDTIVHAGADEIVKDVGAITNFIGDVESSILGNESEIVVKTHETWHEIHDPMVWWNLFCFLVATCVAATLQVIAHTAVDKLEGYEYLKQVFKSLETCMGLGTGGVFWAVFVEVFEGNTPFSWPLRTLYTIGITVVIVASQIVLRKWLTRYPNMNKCVYGGVKFLDVAYNFVMAWAWQAWLHDTFTPSLHWVIGDSGDECSLQHKIHFFLRACQITLLCVAVNAALDVFKARLHVTPEIRQTGLLITGINAGWAWMFFAKSWFGCGSEIQFHFFKLWGVTLAIIAGTLATAFLMDYFNHKVDSHVQDLRKEAGTLDDKDDSYWREYDSSEDSDSYEVDDDSDDDSEDHEKPARRKY